MLKKKAEKGARNDGRINLLHGMEKRIKPKIQRGCLNERVKRIEFSLPFFFFFLIFLQANSSKMIFLEKSGARQSILLARPDKSYAIEFATRGIIFRNEIKTRIDKGRRAEKNKIWNIWRDEGGRRKKNRLGGVKNEINRFADASRLATLERGWIWGMWRQKGIGSRVKKLQVGIVIRSVPLKIDVFFFLLFPLFLYFSLSPFFCSPFLSFFPFPFVLSEVKE